MTECPDCGLPAGWVTHPTGPDYPKQQCYRGKDCDHRTIIALRAQLANQSAELASALRRAETAEQQLAVVEALANHAHERTLWLHVTTFTDNRRAVWVEGGPEVSGHGESVTAAAIDLAQKLCLLDSDPVKP